LLCKVMGVSRSGFYRYIKAMENPTFDVDRELAADAKTVFKGSGGTYGSRRMSRALRALGHSVGRHQARTLMRRLGLRALPTKRFKVTTDSKHSQPVAPNILGRQFDVKAPDRASAGDITYLWTQAGWIYLAVIIDLYSRKVVGWSINRRMKTDLVTDALTMAVWRRKPTPGLIHHTDRGSQGGFNRSSQHWIVEQILDTRPALRREFSSRVFFGAWRSTYGLRLGSLEHSIEPGRYLSESIAAAVRSYSRLCRAAMDCEGRQRKSSHQTRW